jgi:hypothetical protein
MSTRIQSLVTEKEAQKALYIFPRDIQVEGDLAAGQSGEKARDKRKMG